MPKTRKSPQLEKYQFKQKYKWGEPCTKQLNLRVPPSYYEKLQKIDGWQEKLREAIAEMVA